MRASTARLMNSPIRLTDLAFPQVSRLIERTRLAFIHLDNVLAFAKRDRDGRLADTGAVVRAIERAAAPDTAISEPPADQNPAPFLSR